jgi:hypothetical protein
MNGTHKINVVLVHCVESLIVDVQEVGTQFCGRPTCVDKIATSGGHLKNKREVYLPTAIVVFLYETKCQGDTLQIINYTIPTQQLGQQVQELTMPLPKLLSLCRYLAIPVLAHYVDIEILRERVDCLDAT